MADRLSLTDVDGILSEPAAPVEAPKRLSLTDARAEANRPTRTTGDELLRQLGLFARQGMEGAGDGTLSLLASPIRGALNLAGMNLPAAPFAGLADRIGLPKPETSQERILGDASKGMAGALGMAGAAGAAARGATGNIATMLRQLAARRDLQAASGFGAGAAGGIVREEGGSPLAQTGAAVLGGVGAPLALSGAQNAGAAARSLLTRQAPTTNIDIRIQQALEGQGSGITWANLEPGVQSRIRAQVQRAMSQGELNPAAIRRLADYEALGAQPLRGSLTLDPVDITRERNLAKIGAASNQHDMQQLAGVQNNNRARLVEVMNEAGGAGADSFTAGQSVIGRIAARDAGLKAETQALYDAYKGSTGKTLELDRTYFTRAAFEGLASGGKSAFLPEPVKAMLNQISRGSLRLEGREYPVPFTVDVIDQYKTILSNAAKSPDGNVKMAVGAVRDALDATPILEPRTHVPPAGGAVRMGGAEEQAAQQALNLANQARAAHRARMEWHRSHPAIQAVVDGVDPDKFVQTFLIGDGAKSSVRNVSQLVHEISDNPEAKQQLKAAVVRYIKDQATGGAADEVANVSQKRMNDALRKIGDRKLALVFDPPELEQLHRIARVASYETFQPTGSAVNNSNSGTTVAARALDFVTDNGLLRRFPAVAPIVQKPLGAFQTSIARSYSTDIPRGLLMPNQPGPRRTLPLGLLGFTAEDQ